MNQNTNKLTLRQKKTTTRKTFLVIRSPKILSQLHNRWKLRKRDLPGEISFVMVFCLVYSERGYNKKQLPLGRWWA